MSRAIPLALNVAAGLIGLTIGLWRDDTPAWPGTAYTTVSLAGLAIWWALEGRHLRTRSRDGRLRSTAKTSNVWNVR